MLKFNVIACEVPWASIVNELLDNEYQLESMPETDIVRLAMLFGKVFDIENGVDALCPAITVMLEAKSLIVKLPVDGVEPEELDDVVVVVVVGATVIVVILYPLKLEFPTTRQLTSLVLVKVAAKDTVSPLFPVVVPPLNPI